MGSASLSKCQSQEQHKDRENLMTKSENRFLTGHRTKAIDKSPPIFVPEIESFLTFTVLSTFLHLRLLQRLIVLYSGVSNKNTSGNSG